MGKVTQPFIGVVARDGIVREARILLQLAGLYHSVRERKLRADGLAG